MTASVKASLRASLAHARYYAEPYRHWLLAAVFPEALERTLRDLPFATVDLRGVSGKRELHNDARHYFDQVNNARFDACAAVAGAFQSPEIVRAVETAVGADLRGNYVRLEYAQDTDGFWLEPHTDLGVKTFTMLIYLGGADDREDLGTDLYRDGGAWAKRAPFTANTALAFVPGADTWHGLERRPIKGARRSVIMNYVTDAWRAREQLAYPAKPVRA
ncbi:MAG: 2OG-Fe(II) oxygenase [Caulobacteraceae bacterium]|nr:2OG-Fe(II) oxygenase [Caulobacteraceae bacterium]